MRNPLNLRLREKELSSIDLSSTDKDRQIQSLKTRMENLERQKQHLEAVLNGILSSKSWKLTAPLRNFKKFIKVFYPLYRKRTHRMKILEMHDIREDNNEFVIYGPNPYLVLGSDKLFLPSGWLTIKSSFHAPQSHIFFFLYYSANSGFDGQQRFLLPFVSDEYDEKLVHIPSPVKGLRLDPFCSEGTFILRDLEFCEIGKLQVVLRILQRQLSGAFKNPKIIFSKGKKAYALFREGGFRAIKQRLFREDLRGNYEEWVRRYDTLEDADRIAIKKHIESFKHKPLISILMPTYNTPERWLRLAIESVKKQLYSRWELCIADDASSDPKVREVLEEYAASDNRIRISYRKTNGHIGAASNTALSLARGEYIALLDHDDELTHDALYMLVDEINSHPKAALIYSDEDKINEIGTRHNPYFKSGWNPDLLLSQNYVCHLLVCKKDVMDKIGGFREKLDGAQDWDLVLRLADIFKEEGASNGMIRHIPHVLYHWRVVEGSTAQSPSWKPYVFASQTQVVSDHLNRVGIHGAKVEVREDIAQLRVRFPLSQKPLVSIIIPTKDQNDFLRRCIESIEKKNNYKNFEIIVIDNGSEDSKTLAYFESISKNSCVQILNDNGPFNFGRLNNRAVTIAKGEILGFLNNDLEIINDDWLTEMVSHTLRPEIGAVGARLLYPNGLLQHAGVILGIGGIAGHNHKGKPRQDPGYWNRAILPQNLSAVTAACMLVRRSVFEEVDGFDADTFPVAFNDVDLCLRIHQRGYRILYTPYAELYHYESASRGYETTPEKFARFESEISKMKDRWGKVLENDPYYNPNLTLLTEDFAFSFPPRVKKPWKSFK